METAVRKATRLDYNPPKLKHLLTLKTMTFENPASIDTILMRLEKRLKERSWIVTFKALTVVHYLMREGNCVRVVDGVVKRPGVLDASRIKNKSSAPANVHNIYLYRAYLDERVVAFRHLKRDYVAEEKNPSNGEGRLRHLSIKDGLLKELSSLQREIESCVKCTFYLDEGDPSITLFAYRMSIQDILALFQAVNEGIVNLLEHYFELPKTLASTAFEIYKNFVEQTEKTIEYLDIARRVESDLKIDIPPIKHAPLSLSNALEEYLKEGTAAADEKAISQKKELSKLIITEKELRTPQQQQQQQNVISSTDIIFNSYQSSQDSYFDSVSTENATINYPIEQQVMPQQQQNTRVFPQNPFSPLIKSLSQTHIRSEPISLFANSSSNTYHQITASAPISPTYSHPINRPARSDSNPFRAMSNPNMIANYQNPLNRSVTSPNFLPNYQSTLTRSVTNPDLTPSYQDPNITGYFEKPVASFVNPFSPPMTPNQPFPPQALMSNHYQQKNTSSYNYFNPFNNALHHTASI